MLQAGGLMMAAGGGETDPNIAYRVFASRWDGSDGSTTFVDMQGHTVSVAAGAPALTTADKVHGTASLNLPATNARVLIANTGSEFAFGAGQFSVGGWIKRRAGSAYNCYVFGNYVSSLSTEWLLTLFSDGIDKWSFYATGMSRFNTTVPQDVWCHLFVTRDASNVVRGYFNAVEDGSFTLTNNFSTATALRVGEAAVGQPRFVGRVDDLVVYKGVALTQPQIAALMSDGIPTS